MIRLHDRLYLDRDALNWILLAPHVVERGKRAGSTKWTAVGYYAQLGAALRAALNRGLTLDDTGTVRELAARFEAWAEHLHNVGRGVVP